MLHRSQSQSHDRNLHNLNLLRKMTTAKTTLGFNMKHFRKTCVQAAAFVSMLAAAGSSHAQLGSFEASIASISSLVQVCTEAYPQQDLPIRAVLQAAVQGHFGEDPLRDGKYRQLMSTSEMKVFTAQSIQDLKQQSRQGRLNLQKACLTK